MQTHEFEQRIDQLTNHQWKLLEVLIKADSQWVTRRQIATAIGKRRLIPYDIGCLKMLQEKELVDMEHINDNTPIGYQVVYRISVGTATALKQINKIQENSIA
jgi:DNA-binding response OmpR family regulator